MASERKKLSEVLQSQQPVNTNSNHVSTLSNAITYAEQGYIKDQFSNIRGFLQCSSSAISTDLSRSSSTISMDHIKEQFNNINLLRSRSAISMVSIKEQFSNIHGSYQGADKQYPWITSRSSSAISIVSIKEQFLNVY